MSNPHRRFVAAIGALTALAACRAGAQVVDSSMTRVRQLDAVLAVRLAEASAIRERTRLDSGYVNVAGGAFVVRSAPVVAAKAQQAATAAYAAMSSRGGRILDAVLATHVPLLSADTIRRTGLRRLPTYTLRADTARDRARGRIESMYAPLRVNELANRLASLAEDFVTQSAEGPLAQWRVSSLPLRPALPAEWTEAYVEYATGESAALRRCRTDDEAACLIVLGIGDLAAPLDAWYEPQDYRSLTRRMAPIGDDSATIAAWMRCDVSGDDAACERAARSIPPSRVPLPLTMAVRRLLVDETLRIGGPAALDRLMAKRGSMRERIEAAAGVPMEQVVRQWRQHVIDARAPAMRVDAGLLFATLGWSSLILAVALIRRGSWS